MNFLEQEIAPLGLGCWPIGGKMFAADGQSLGYSNVDHKESLNTIRAALDNGIRLFDTAAAYGAGHSERLLAEGLKDCPDAQVVTKIGIAIDEHSKTLTGDEISPTSVLPATERCLKRLGRERIDLLLLHQNGLSIEQALPLFDEMEKARESGKIEAYGWSTDFTKSAEAMADRPGFVAVEHAMNVLVDAPRIQHALQRNNLFALIRSPLAMGLLSGKYTTDTKISDGDIRATNQGWLHYYRDGHPNSEYMDRVDAVRELLQTGGRTVVQGALGWLWSKSNNNIAIPGARTVEQIVGIAGALQYGGLPENIMNEIDLLIGKDSSNEQDCER